MAAPQAVTLSNRYLQVQIDRRDLAAHVTVKATGETLRMAGAQPDDVMMHGQAGSAWKSFTDSPVTVRKGARQAVSARLAGLGLAVKITLDGSDVVFEVAPAGPRRRAMPRDVLYPRHFLLPTGKNAYATFPLGQGSIIPANWKRTFHHREGYSEAVAHWIGGYTGRTGYCAIAETPDDLYQAVDHSAGQAASCFIHWLGSLGELRYPRRVRYHFAKGLDYVAQAKHYREHCKRVGWFRSLEDKAAENPNVARLKGGPIICVGACHRRERTMEYTANKFTDLARSIERFRKASGIRNAVVHVDGWGYWGYDAMHPDVLPPNDDCGGAAGLTDLANRVKKAGYLFGLHDQYIDFYAHAPSYNESMSIGLESGRGVRVNRWCGGLCGHLCYHYIPGFVERNYFHGVHETYPIYHNSRSIWELCAPTASYLDCFCRTVECWRADHPMTRTQARERMNETFEIVRRGADGQMVVLSVEHPRDYSAALLDFGWSLGHLSIDVPTTAGAGSYAAEGIPVPLWHLVFHDAVAVPSPGRNLAEALLYGQAPYFWPTRAAIPAAEMRRKKVLLKLHEDVGFAEMTGHEILSADGSVQRSTFAGGVEVDVDKAAGSYCISAGKARTKGARKL